ncbi:uncharacterized protein TNCT_650881 [Trichonephila clavata]|uniref:Uncharacterized protein n=1 Tax=Trichonephila clavata TaxID=2740835 RepID=A0A8X6FZS4_TRICU|nr:uncharacterized protein TNCT_650881 [Trichonephila clavata]
MLHCPDRQTKRDPRSDSFHSKTSQMMRVLEANGQKFESQLDTCLSGLDSRGLGIHQGQPSYLPAYNGIFSIHALNFTPAAIDKTENYLHVDNHDTVLGYSSNASLENLVATDQSPTTLIEKADSQSQSTDDLNQNVDDGTDMNEVDAASSKKDNPPDIADAATFPQIQVITKTIAEETFEPPTTTTQEAPKIEERTLKMRL